MAIPGTNFSNLPVAIGLTGDEVVPIVQGGTDKRTTTQGIADLALNSASIQTLLDQITDTRGAILFRGASAWQALSPSTAGYVLTTQGPAANPTWDANLAADITVGSSIITGGTNTRILYNNAGVVGEYTITGTGTVVAMQTSPTFVTPTLGVAGATSILFPAVAAFADAQIEFAQGTVGIYAIDEGGGGSFSVSFKANNRFVGGFRYEGLGVPSDLPIGFVGNTTFSTIPDAQFWRDGAADTIAMRRDANAQTFRVYNTYSGGGTDYERANLGWATNLFRISTTGGGTGATNRAIEIQAGGKIDLLTGTGWGFGFVEAATTRWSIEGGTGKLLAGQDNVYDIGASGATRPRSIYVGTNITANNMVKGAVFNGGTNSIVLLQNDAGNDFNRLQFGGTTSSFPALKRSTTTLQVRLADDSADAGFSALTGAFSGALTVSVNGALSAPAINGTGTWITGGSATTTKPYALIEPTGTTSTAWSTSGTGLGINAASGFSGHLINCQVAAADRFNVNSSGGIRSYATNEALTLEQGYAFAAGGYRIGSSGTLRFSDGADFDTGIYHGLGSPEGVVVASPGSLYLNRSGGTDTTLYTKNSGDATNTGWVAVDNV